MRRRQPVEERIPTLTPNQVVAYNLPRARLVRGWTQEQAAEALAPYLGTRWSVANFSAIERSVDGNRIRQFTADDLLALSRGFDLPIGFFLTPPVEDPRAYGIATPDSGPDGADPMVLLDAVLGTEENLGIWETEIAQYGVSAGRRAVVIDGKWEDRGRNVPDQRGRTRDLVQARVRLILAEELGDLASARTTLAKLMGLIEAMEAEGGQSEAAEIPKMPEQTERNPR
jgi:transcriptional regulator with XRE-family HTH domain